MKHHNYKKQKEYRHSKEVEKHKDRNEALYKFHEEKEKAKKKYGLIEDENINFCEYCIHPVEDIDCISFIHLSKEKEIIDNRIKYSHVNCMKENNEQTND